MMAGLERTRTSREHLLATDVPVSQAEDMPITPDSGFLHDSAQSSGHVFSVRNGDPRRAFFVRGVALLCAMSLSIGSNYGSYILGPLKSQLSHKLGTDNTEFSILISAFSLNGTWTPLVGGIIVSRLGTTLTSILATGVILLGQIILLLGNISENVRLMAFGMFIFGLGISPVSVVQETIIVRFFRSHGLGFSLGLGLIAGKGSSFAAASTAYPLTEHFGSQAPFYMATALAALSFSMNLVYVSVSKWLVEGTDVEPEATDVLSEARVGTLTEPSDTQALKLAAKGHVSFDEVTKLGDIFWAYLGLNVLCGAIWLPLTHLAANIFQHRYDLTESTASHQASYLLVGSVFLYPVCGYLVDTLKTRPIVTELLLLSSCLTMFCYIWLALPAGFTGTAVPAVATFAFGIGFSPLLLVVLVPQLVPLKFVSTTLGAHKSIEQAGSVICQTMAGWILDGETRELSSVSTGGAIQHLLNILLVLNFLQFLGVLGLHRRQKRVLEYPLLDRAAGRIGEEAIPLHGDGALDEEGWRDVPRSRSARVGAGGDESVGRRGKVSALLCCAVVMFAWLFFMGTAALRLRSKSDRGSGSVP